MNIEGKRKIIIAIDGYSSCGKSTLAKQLASRLQYNYVDSGAMYRAVTLYALQNRMVADGKLNQERLIKSLDNIHISFVFNETEGKSDTYLNGVNVEKEIRGLEVSAFVSPVATIREVRAEMVRQQKAMGEGKGIVMDGRDIGTVVFPLAELKIFMTATPEIRAHRRYDELKSRGVDASYSDILNNVVERDYIDRNRDESPLMRADDALILDNSYLGQTEQLNWALEQVNRVLNDHRNR